MNIKPTLANINTVVYIKVSSVTYVADYPCMGTGIGNVGGQEIIVAESQEEVLRKLGWLA